MSRSQSYIITESMESGAYVPLGDRLVIGRKPGMDTISRTDNADVMLLITESAGISYVSADRCHLLIYREGGKYLIEDCTFATLKSSVGRLNGEVFNPNYLTIGDQISLGDAFHFHFDGTGLRRVAPQQGARIEAIEVFKTYYPPVFSWRKQPVIALRNASVTIEPNEFVGVLGPSGGGKSTLIKILCGAVRPTEGHVYIDEVDVHGDPELMYSKVGFVPQDDIVHPELTVEEAISISAALRFPRGVHREARKLHVDSVLRQMGLEKSRYNRVRELSGGQRKRVSIATEILKKSSVIFLDEPSSGLDPGREDELMQQLSAMAKQGRTIVCTTHVLYSDHLFHKLCIVAKGVIVYFGPTEDACAYFGKESIKDIYSVLDDPDFEPVPWQGVLETEADPEEIAEYGWSLQYTILGILAILSVFMFMAVAWYRFG